MSAPAIVDELESFAAGHHGITITSPRQNGTLMWRATWLAVGAADAEGTTETVERDEPEHLLAYLKARFGR